jgi:hypothetical protein
MADDPKKLKEINDEIAKLRKELGKIPSSPFEAKDLDKAIESLNGLRASVRDLDSDLSYVKDSFIDIVNSLSKQNRYLIDAKSSLKGISGIAQKITEYRKGETSLSEKQLKTLQQQSKSQFEILERSLKVGNLKTKEKEDIKEALNSQIEFNRELESTINAQKQVNKDIGLLGTGIGGVSKLLGKMGFGDMTQSLQDAIDKTKNARLQTILNKNEIGEINKLQDLQIKGYKNLSMEDKQLYSQLIKRHGTDKEANEKKILDLQNQNKELETQTSKYKNIGKALKEQLTSANLIDFVFVNLITAFNTSQKSIGELAKGLGMSASSAVSMRQDFASIANSSMDANVSVKGLQEAQLAVGQALGTNAQLNDEDLKTLTKITKQTGLTHDELMGMEKLSLAQGKNLGKQIKQTLGGANAYAAQNKLVVNQNKVLQEVSKASGSLKLSLGGSVEALGKAVVQSQKFGINLQTAESMAKGLLDFESSIQSELEAELLTGKTLNFEKARQLALEGKSTEAAAEMLKQVKGSAEFSKMNVIQQEAMANAVNMTKDELADSLIEREALAAMAGEEGQSALERYNILKAQGKTEEDMAKILGEKAAKQLEQQSSQEKFNSSLEKAQEIFVQIMDAIAPIFDVLSSIVTTVLPAINFILQPIITAFTGLGKILTGSFDTLTGWQTILGAIAIGVATIYTVTNATAVVQKGQQMIDAVRLGYQTAMGSLAAREALMQKKGLALSIGKASMNAIASLSAIPIVGWALGLAAAGTVAALGYSYMKDGMIGPGGEMIVSGPKGSIQLDKDDSIIAGTNLMGNGGDKSQTQTTQQPTQPNQNTERMIALLQQQNALLQQIASRQTTIEMNGDKVGQGIQKADRVIQ